MIEGGADVDRGKAGRGIVVDAAIAIHAGLSGREAGVKQVEREW